MFNLPFPTDSLYKFAFTFGLVLIVFSVYYGQNNLTYFNWARTYNQIDSIKRKVGSAAYVLRENQIFLTQFERYEKKFLKLVSNEKNAAPDINSIIHQLDNQDSVYSSNLLFERLKHIKYADTIGVKAVFQNYLANRLNKNAEIYLNRFLKIAKPDAEKKGLETIVLYQEKLIILESEINVTNTYFVTMLCTGVLLFIVGLILWYFRIQKPQDTLLIMQLEEAIKKDNKAKAIKVRKHFEPQILPRPQVRNRV